MSNISVAVDLMGGDHAPQSVSQAVISVALSNPHVHFYAVGLPHVISQYFSTKPSNITVVPAGEAIGMEISAAEASRIGTNSSIGKMLELNKEGVVQSCISAGNTAALMTLAYLILKTKPGVRRPSILSFLEYKGKQTYITDLGANIGCKAQDLVANAKVAVAEHPLEDPSLVLLNVGVESSKGTPEVKEAYKLLNESDISFNGYIEGWDILTTNADIVVCDGFVGNCITKLLESMLSITSPHIENKSLLPKVNNVAMLAGLNGLVFKAHGDSKTEDLIRALDEVISYQESIIAA